MNTQILKGYLGAVILALKVITVDVQSEMVARDRTTEPHPIVSEHTYNSGPRLVQEPSPRQRLLSSNGNIRVSKLFREAPVLPVDDLSAEIYRITIIPTFYNPIKIRVEKRKDQYVLIAKRLSGQGGYDAGKLKTERSRTLHSREWNHLLDLLKEAKFWELPYLDKEPEANEKGEVSVCVDGSEWMIEGVKNSKYHVVDRYCPELKSFQAIGLYLVTLSGLRVKQRELY